MALLLPPSTGPTRYPLSTLFGVGTGTQRGRGPGEASDQRTEAIHRAHSR